MFALPIFTARASYRHAVRNSPVDCCRHKKEAAPFGAASFGSPCWTRTNDLRINSPSLYRLS